MKQEKDNEDGLSFWCPECEAYEDESPREIAGHVLSAHDENLFSSRGLQKIRRFSYKKRKEYDERQISLDDVESTLMEGPTEKEDDEDEWEGKWHSAEPERSIERETIGDDVDREPSAEDNKKGILTGIRKELGL